MRSVAWALCGGAVVVLGAMGAGGLGQQPDPPVRPLRPDVVRPGIVRPGLVEPEKPQETGTPVEPSSVSQPAPTSPPARRGWTDRPSQEEIELPVPNRGTEPPGTGHWLNASLTLTLASGEVRGSVISRGREGTIDVYGLDHIVEGNQYGLVRLTIGPDRSIPELLGAMGQSGAGAKATIQFWGSQNSGVASSAAGIEVQRFTIELEGVRIERVRLTRNFDFNEVDLGFDTITYRSMETGYAASAAR